MLVVTAACIGISTVSVGSRGACATVVSIKGTGLPSAVMRMPGSVQPRMITSAPRSLAAPTRRQPGRRPYLRRNSRFDVLFGQCNDSKRPTDHTSCTVCGVRAPAFGATQLGVRYRGSASPPVEYFGRPVIGDVEMEWSTARCPSKSGAVRPAERSTPSWRSRTERRGAASCLCKAKAYGFIAHLGRPCHRSAVASAETSPMKGEV